MTPPSKLNRPVSQIETIANDLLARSGVVGFSWGVLTPRQQVGFAFMINDSLHECFPSVEEAAQEMTKAVIVPYSAERDGENYYKYQNMNKNIYNFIRKGGDRVLRVEENEAGNELSNTDGRAKYRHHVRKYPVFENPEQSTTIYSLYRNLRPYLRYQLTGSMACCSLNANIAIDLSNGCRLEKEEKGASTSLGEVESEHMKRFALNVSRFMRMLPSQQQYSYIFLGHGFFLNRMITSILQPFNPHRRCDDTAQFLTAVLLPTSQAGESELDDCYRNLKSALRGGPLFTDKFRVYKGFGTSDMCDIIDGQRKSFLGMRHAITIVGAARTPEKTGVFYFLFRTHSCEKFPFKNVGLDLLLEMGIIDLCYLRGDLKFPKKSPFFDIEPGFLCTYSEGSSPFICSAVISEQPTEAEMRAVAGWFHWLP